MEKLLAIVSLSQNLYGRWLFRRLLFGVITLVSLTIVVSMLVSAVLISGFYVAYQVLLNFGFEQKIAMAVIACALLSITIMLAFFIAWHLRRLRKIPKRLPTEKIPSAAAASDAIDAFLEGLMSDPAYDFRTK